MAKKPVFILPGIFGSTLETVENNKVLFTTWLDAVCLARGQCLAYLKLAADGVSPFFGAKVPSTRPWSVMESYYKALFNACDSADTYPVPLPYEWRGSVRATGRYAWRFIEREYPEGEFYIVAHSLGGLLARIVWSELGRVGGQERLLRIVTMGTPHWGSYDACRTATQTSASWRAFYDAMRLGRPVQTRGRIERALAEVCWSWPSLYDLLPAWNLPDLVNVDPHRRRAYDISRYPSNAIGGMYNAHFTSSAIGHWDAMAAAIPPQGRLTPIIGIGKLTANRLKDVQEIHDDTAFNFGGDGDGVVDPLSAGLDGRPRFSVNSGHASLPRHPAVLTHLLSLILSPLTENLHIPQPQVYD